MVVRSHNSILYLQTVKIQINPVHVQWPVLIWVIIGLKSSHGIPFKNCMKTFCISVHILMCRLCVSHPLAIESKYSTDGRVHNFGIFRALKVNSCSEVTFG